MHSQPVNDTELDISLGDGEVEHIHSAITVEKIREMVELFYRRTQGDELLGPIFADRMP